MLMARFSSGLLLFVLFVSNVFGDSVTTADTQLIAIQGEPQTAAGIAYELFTILQKSGAKSYVVNPETERMQGMNVWAEAFSMPFAKTYYAWIITEDNLVQINSLQNIIKLSGPVAEELYYDIKNSKLPNDSLKHIICSVNPGTTGPMIVNCMLFLAK